MTPKQIDAVTIAEMAKDIAYIKEALVGTDHNPGLTSKVAEHDNYITQAKTAQALIKWAVGSGWLVSIIGFVWVLVRR